MIEFSNVKKVTFNINQEDGAYRKKGSLDIVVFLDDGHQRTFHISANGDKLVIGEGGIFCPYIPNLSQPAKHQIFEQKVGYKERLNYDK